MLIWAHHFVEKQTTSIAYFSFLFMFTLLTLKQFECRSKSLFVVFGIFKLVAFTRMAHFHSFEMQEYNASIIE